MSVQTKKLINLLQAKRRDDPKGFRKYLPGVEELLPPLPVQPSVPSQPFVLTERERAYHQDGLSQALTKMDQGVITAEDARLALQHCAILIKDWNLLEEVAYETLKGLVKKVTGRSPGSYKAKTTVPLNQDEGQDEGSPVMEQVSVIRGVYLGLDREMRLVSIFIDPRKFRERRKLMAIVGIGKDTATDVALRHDYYLTAQGPNDAL